MNKLACIIISDLIFSEYLEGRSCAPLSLCTFSWGLVFLFFCVHVVLHVMMACGLVDGHQYYRGMYCYYLQIEMYP